MRKVFLLRIRSLTRIALFLSQLCMAVASNQAFSNEDQTSLTPQQSIQNEDQDEFKVKTSWNVVYGDSNESSHVGDLYVPVSPVQAEVSSPEVGKERKYPGVLMIHGGAWTTGSKFHTSSHAKRLAARGFVVFSINYRLAPKHTFPTQLDDCDLALNWLVKNGEKHQIDTQKLCIWGYSAGGHLASLLTLKHSDSKLKEPDSYSETVQFQIAGCVCGGAPFDLVQLSNGKSLLEPIFVPASERNSTLEKRQQYLAEASPLQREFKSLPPFYLFHGAKDFIVPAKQSRQFRDKLIQANQSVELKEYSDRGHLTTFADFAIAAESFDFLERVTKSAP